MAGGGRTIFNVIQRLHNGFPAFKTDDGKTGASER